MNLFDVLKLDIESLESEYRKLSSVLEKIGLSEYESRAFVAIIVKNQASADEVAELAGMPRTSAYKALQSLMEKQFVTSVEGRPTIFYPVPLEQIRSRELGGLEEAFNKLEAIKGLLSEKGIPQLVYTISGKRGVLSKLGEMLDASKTRFVISTPAIQEVRSEHGHRFKEAIGRGVEVIIITEPMLKIPQCSRSYRKKDLLATDVICDGQSAMIAAPDLSLCGFSDNPFISSHLDNFMRMVIERLDAAQENARA
jgi:HTH-type transcriptional regulator, sugar sensing transcriptional regulator